MKAVALLLINLPGALALAGGVSFYLSNRSTGFLTIAGERRGYVLHVPEGHSPSRPAPLVISLHGAGLWGAAQRDISGWNAVADREGFIVAYPSGAGWGRASPRVWHVDPDRGMARDVAFIAQLVDTLSARYNVDRDRVYVNGLSNGGGMTFVLSCVLADRIAAAGVVSSAITMRRTACPPLEQRAVPVIAFHGTADPVTPYAGGKAWIAPRAFPSVPEWIQSWAERNRCAPNPRDSLVAANVTRRAYVRCADGADVVLYTLHGGGHVWPGGMSLPRWLVGGAEGAGDVDASREMWAFFRERRLSH